MHEGFTYYNDAIAEVRYGAKAARNPPKRACRWRMMLGQSAEQEEYAVLEDVVDWSGLEVKMKRRKIPELVQKLITVYGPTKRSFEEWKSDFEKTKKVRKTASTGMKKQAANVAEPAHNDDDAEQQADSFDQIELDVS